MSPTSEDERADTQHMRAARTIITFISARFRYVRATRTFGRYPAHDIDDNDCRIRASARDPAFSHKERFPGPACERRGARRGASTAPSCSWSAESGVRHPRTHPDSSDLSTGPRMSPDSGVSRSRSHEHMFTMYDLGFIPSAPGRDTHLRPRPRYAPGQLHLTLTSHTKYTNSPGTRRPSVRTSGCKHTSNTTG